MSSKNLRFYWNIWWQSLKFINITVVCTLMYRHWIYKVRTHNQPIRIVSNAWKPTPLTRCLLSHFSCWWPHSCHIFDMTLGIRHLAIPYNRFLSGEKLTSYQYQISTTRGFFDQVFSEHLAHFISLTYSIAFFFQSTNPIAIFLEADPTFRDAADLQIERIFMILHFEGVFLSKFSNLVIKAP